MPGVTLVEHTYSASTCKVHSLACLELKKISEKITKIFTALESARPRCKAGLQALCSLHKCMEKCELLFRHCSESSKLYLAISGQKIILRCQRICYSLELCLGQLQNMVEPTLAAQISKIVDYIRSVVFTLDSSEDEAGKVLLGLLHQDIKASKFAQPEELKAFKFAASRLHITSPLALVIEKRSIRNQLSKVLDTDPAKKKILNYLLYLVLKYGKSIKQEETESIEGDEDDAFDSLETPLKFKWTLERLKVVRVKTLHISSPILAARSPFFYKLFSNGMKESERHVKLRISALEEAALMELLNFMYSNNLTVTTAPELLEVLMAADKFEVVSCMRYCSHLLRNLPMTPESAIHYLELPSSVLMAEAVQPLTVAAKQFLAVRYKDITKFQDEVLKLPLYGLEAIISSDDLHVASEDIVYEFVLKWVRARYPNLDDRRQILRIHLAKYIRFPYMTCRKLRKVLTCADFDPDFAQQVVIEALFYKADAPHRQRTYISDESSNINHRFIERAYKYLPIKVVEFEQPRPQCVVYLDLKHEECASLFPSSRVYSQAFHLSGQGFFLSAHCNLDQQSSFHCFGLFLGMQEKGSASFAVDYEFSARSKPDAEFVSKYKGTYVFTGGKAVGYRNLFATPWTSFIGEDSVYFIDGVLHLRAELTARR